ncbi:microtubule organizer protein 1 [Ceratobasidium sp. AG-Ba]|nr:microtubule organizer protein 1 [Ceratobasidium sp. AG-Ba]
MKHIRRVKKAFRRRFPGSTASLPESGAQNTTANDHARPSDAHSYMGAETSATEAPTTLLIPNQTLQPSVHQVSGHLSPPTAPVRAFPAPMYALDVPVQGASYASTAPIVTQTEGPAADQASEIKSTANVEHQAPQALSSPAGLPASAAKKQAPQITTAWGLFERFMGVMLKVGALALGPIESARNDVARCAEVFETVSESQEDYASLKVELHKTLNQLCDFFGEDASLAQSPSVVSLAKAIEVEILRVIRKLNRTGTEKAIEAREDPADIAECHNRVQGLLQRMELNVNLNVWKTVGEIATDAHLRSLPVASEAKHRSAESDNLRRVGCTPNTRIEVLNDLSRWANDRSSEKIYWLNGMAGTGKTTITYSFCEELRARERLAASFYCSRQVPSCRNVNRIVPTISYQLALFSRPFRHAVSTALKDLEVHNQPLPEQFECLVAKPLREIEKSLPFNLVIVIDALDECEQSEQVGKILDILLSHTQTLPVKVFVASRPEAGILKKLQRDAKHRASKELRLHELDRPMVQGDIKLYLHSKLKVYHTISQDDIELLAKRSDVLFIYAATVVRYIESGGDMWIEKRLKEVFDSYRVGTSLTNGEKEIDALYTTILKSVIEGPGLNGDERELIKLILDTVICAQEPLSIDVLAGLLKLDSGTIVGPAISSLSSVLHKSDETGVITTLHASFPDYLLSAKRSGDFYCDPGLINEQLSHRCFDQILSIGTSFNICNLTSSYVLDSEVEGIKEEMNMVISEECLYSCRYWGAHMQLAEASIDHNRPLLLFLSTKLLVWMEIMNLKKLIKEAVAVLYDARESYGRDGNRSEDICSLLWDAWEFVSGFASFPVQLSTPHIYVSYLSFWPEDRPVSQHYRLNLRVFTKTSTALRARQSTSIQVIDTHKAIICVANSMTSTRIAVGYRNGSIQIWDRRNGQPVGEQLHGHTGPVWSVGYSPDGAYIVSGSDDKTVRIWDARTGQPVGEPLHGHTGSVWSVGYSPDGAYIVSGSDDNTVRIWDARTGQPVGEPLHGHTGWVRSVGYSPDGAYIVSGSDDETVRIWDARTGQPVGEPLHGHTGSVYSVGYSPDGAYIVSGSLDKTVRIWDARTRQPFDGPVERSTEPVRHATYSPDRTCIATCSASEIRIKQARFCTMETSSSQSSAYARPPVVSPNSSLHICNSACRAPSPHRPWSLSEDGWVVTDHSRRLAWLPPDLRSQLLHPEHMVLISTRGFLQLDFHSDGINKVGDSWAKYFRPLVQDMKPM